MLSRRIIRVKVMQALFIWQTTPGLNHSDIIDFYDSSIRSTYDLFAYQLYLLSQITRHALEDAERRQTKLLPTEFDKHFTAKLFENPITQALIKDKELINMWEKAHVSDKVPEDFTKKLYKTFALSDAYTHYVNTDGGIESHIEILLTLYKELINQEFYNDITEDYFYNWLDDESIIVGTIKKVLKALPETNILANYGPISETIEEFGKTLLVYILENEKQMEDFIRPLLENWELDRVALVDRILIKMSVSEMIIFPTIPTKVSINEYVELAKAYSTDKSKEFVNGILDKSLKTLAEENKVNKVGRGLIE